MPKEKDRLNELDDQLKTINQERQKLLDFKIEKAKKVKDQIDQILKENNLFGGIILRKEDVVGIVSKALETNEQITIEYSVYIK
jgi:hypothetical protein